MLFELYDVQKQNALIQTIQQSRQATYRKLVGSYSKKDKNSKCLRQNFQALLKQSALLLHILRQIEQNVRHKNLLPILFNSSEIDKLLYNQSDLPEWFQHVFQKEYKKQKPNLETTALKIYKLHGLGQKNAELVIEHWNIQILLKRYSSLNQNQLENIDIIRQVEAFRCLYQNCRKVYTNFLQMMATKVVQFMQKIVLSTLVYSNQLKQNVHSQKYVTEQPYGRSPYGSIYSPKAKLATQNVSSRNTLNSATHKFINGIKQPVYEGYQLDQTLDKTKLYPSVQKLKTRQKSNNQFFFREAKRNNRMSQNQQTQQTLHSVKGQYKSNHNISHKYLACATNRPKQYEHQPKQYENRSKQYEHWSKQYQKSCEKINKYIPYSSKQNQHGDITLRTYKSSENLLKSQNLFSTQNLLSTQKYNEKNIQNKKSIERIKSLDRRDGGILKKLSQDKNCYHHCPHHDKFVNNHCSKHCDRQCSHEKNYKNSTGLSLAQMNKQFYEKQTRNKSPQTINLKLNHEPIPYRHSMNKQQDQLYTSRSKRQPNFVQSRGYLRNSHEKHQMFDLYLSPQSKNSNYFQKNSSRSKDKPYQRVVNSRFKPIASPQRQSPYVRACEYYYC